MIMNVLFSGASLVTELLSQLKENNHIQEAMRSMLPTGTTEIELKEVLHYVLRTYSMRGKYYVRRIVSRSKASLKGENIRSAIAVKAGIAQNTATARHANNKKRTSTSSNQDCVTMRQLVSEVPLDNDQSEEEN
jgi:hypothetical protein